MRVLKLLVVLLLAPQIAYPYYVDPKNIPNSVGSCSIGETLIRGAAKSSNIPKEDSSESSMCNRLFSDKTSSFDGTPCDDKYLGFTKSVGSDGTIYARDLVQACARDTPDSDQRMNMVGNYADDGTLESVYVRRQFCRQKLTKSGWQCNWEDTYSRTIDASGIDEDGTVHVLKQKSLKGYYVCLRKFSMGAEYPQGGRSKRRDRVCGYVVNPSAKECDSSNEFFKGVNRAVIGCIDLPLAPLPPVFNWSIPSTLVGSVVKSTVSEYIKTYKSRFDQPVIALQLSYTNASGVSTTETLALRYRFAGDTGTALGSEPSYGAFTKAPTLKYYAYVPISSPQLICVGAVDTSKSSVTITDPETQVAYVIGCVARPNLDDSYLKIAALDTTTKSPNDSSITIPGIFPVIAKTYADTDKSLKILSQSGRSVILDSTSGKYYYVTDNVLGTKGTSECTTDCVSAAGVRLWSYDRLTLPVYSASSSSSILYDYQPYSATAVDESGSSITVKGYDRNQISAYGITFSALIPALTNGGEFSYVKILTPTINAYNNLPAIYSIDTIGSDDAISVINANGSRDRSNCVCTNCTIDPAPTGYSHVEAATNAICHGQYLGSNSVTASDKICLQYESDWDAGTDDAYPITTISAPACVAIPSSLTAITNSCPAVSVASSATARTTWDLQVILTNNSSSTFIKTLDACKAEKGLVNAYTYELQPTSIGSPGKGGFSSKNTCSRNMNIKNGSGGYSPGHPICFSSISTIIRANTCGSFGAYAQTKTLYDSARASYKKYYFPNIDNNGTASFSYMPEYAKTKIDAGITTFNAYATQTTGYYNQCNSGASYSTTGSNMLLTEAKLDPTRTCTKSTISGSSTATYANPCVFKEGCDAISTAYDVHGYAIWGASKYEDKEYGTAVNSASAGFTQLATDIYYKDITVTGTCATGYSGSAPNRVCRHYFVNENVSGKMTYLSSHWMDPATSCAKTS